MVAKVTAEQEGKQLESVLWANILKSVSAYFMYRQAIQIEINGKSVIYFLVNNQELSRSIKHCVSSLHRQTEILPRSEDVDASLHSLVQLVNQKIPFELGSDLLHDYLDDIQLKLSSVHQSFYNAWFHPKIEQQMQNQQ